MYFLLTAVFSAVSMLLLINGVRTRKAWRSVTGIGLGVLTCAIFGCMAFGGEALWGEAARGWVKFRLPMADRVLCGLGGGGLALGAVWVLTLYAFPNGRLLRWVPRSAAFLLGSLWGWQNRQAVLFFWYGVSRDLSDSIFGGDVGFYLFKLPLLEQLYHLLSLLFILGVGTLLLSLYVGPHATRRVCWRSPDLSRREESRQNHLLYTGLAVFFFLLAWGKYLDQFRLMYSDAAAIRGAGWMDVYVRLSASRLLIVFTAAVGVTVLIPRFRRRMRDSMARRRAPQKILSLTPALMAGYCTAVLWVTALWVVPPVFQWLTVGPGVQGRGQRIYYEWVEGNAGRRMFAEEYADTWEWLAQAMKKESDYFEKIDTSAPR